MRNPIIPAVLGVCVVVCSTLMGADEKPAPPLIPEGAEVEVVAEGFKFTEGPAAAPDGSIYFTDIPNNRIHRYDPKTGETAVFREDSGGANGLMFTKHGLLIACEGKRRRVVALYESGSVDELAERFGKARLNSPNDVVTHDGHVYFTDPRYGKRDDMTLDHESVYYVAEYMKPRHRKVTRLTDDLQRPNGIGISPDKKTLYINDNGTKKVMAYPILDPGKLGDGKVLHDLAEIGGPDGMAVDHAGRLYIAIFQKGILILSPDGERLGFIETGPRTSNCTFGADGQTLYITSEGKLKRIKLNTGMTND